jgi:hypothetical protein
MLQMLQKDQRVHFINLGFESKWILDSFEKSRPDKVYLIRQTIEGEKAEKAQKEIEDFLKETKAEFKLVNFDSTIYNLIKILKEKIEEEKANQIYLCVSAGQRDSTSAFILSSMLFHKIPKDMCLYSAKEGDFVELPHFEVNLPKNEILEAVKFLAINEEKGCTKKILKTHMFKNNLLEIGKCKDKEHTEYVKLNRAVLNPAEKDWRLIDIDGKRKGSLITLTEEGKKWAKIF